MNVQYTNKCFIGKNCVKFFNREVKITRSTKLRNLTKIYFVSSTFSREGRAPVKHFISKVKIGTVEAFLLFMN